MKSILAYVYYTSIAVRKLFGFSKTIASRSASSTIVLVDIDNTLADTWITLTYSGYQSEADRNSRLAVFIQMRAFVNEMLKDNQYEVFFISARNPSLQTCTVEWLLGNSINVKPEQVVLVPWAKHKLMFIKKAISHFKRVIYIDDLSFGHEKGEVKLYENLIGQVKRMPIEYIGVEEINKINRQGYDSKTH